MSEAERTNGGDGRSRVFVEHKLRDAWHKERRFHHTRGLCFLLVWAAMLVVLDLLVDWLFLASYRAPGWSRVTLLGVNVVTLALVLHHYWWRHLQAYNPVRLALQIERKHPELKSLLVSYVQIDERLQAETQASPVLVAALRREAVMATRPIDFREVVSFKVLTRLFLFSAGVLAFFAGVSAYKSEFFRTLIRRMLNPIAHIEYPTRTVIERITGNMTIQQGRPLSLTAICAGEIPEKGRLHVRADEGTWEKLSFLKESGNVFSYRFSEVRQSFDYYVSLGDDESGRYRVDVVPAPKVVKKRIELAYPAYTNLAPKRDHDSYYIEVPEGTKITWRLTCDRAIESVQMIRNRQETIAMTVGGNGYVAEVTLPAGESFEYQFRWEVAGHRFIYETPGAYMVNVIPDLAPEVEIVQPVQDEKATVRKRLSVQFRARDDYGLSEARLIYSLNDGAEKSWSVGRVSENPASPSFEKKLAELIAGLKKDDVVTYCVEVADNRGDERGPQVSRSRQRRVYVVSIAEYLRGILEEQLRWVSEIEELRGEERQAEEQVEPLKTAETQPSSRPAGGT